MSFLRHRETHQNHLQCQRARPCGHALTHRADESPVGYSWRVALQQSPLPLHQPRATLQQCRGDLQQTSCRNMDPTLTRCLTLGVHPSCGLQRAGERCNTHFVRSGFVMFWPTRGRRALHTHFVRSGFVMFWPTRRPTALHTHFVRSGFVMFWPTRGRPRCFVFVEA